MMSWAEQIGVDDSPSGIFAVYYSLKVEYNIWFYLAYKMEHI